MRRRKFVITTSLAALGASAHLSMVSKPSVAIDFNLSNVDQVPAGQVESLQINFDSFSFNTEYVNENEPIDVTVQASVSDSSGEVASNSEQATIAGFNNGEDYDASGDIPSVTLSGVNTSDDFLNGDITVELEHSDIGTEQYNQTFSISATEILQIIRTRVGSLKQYEADAIAGRSTNTTGVYAYYVGPQSKTDPTDNINGIERSYTSITTESGQEVYTEYRRVGEETIKYGNTN